MTYRRMIVKAQRQAQRAVQKTDFPTPIWPSW